MTHSATGLPTAGQAAIARFADHVKELKARTAEAQDALSGASATLSRDAVTVTVDANGVLTGLTLGETATGSGLDGLARVIVSLARQAHADALQQASTAVGVLVGPDSPAVALLDRQRSELVEAVAPGATADPARFTPVEDDDAEASAAVARCAVAIELPGPVADFLGFIGISWPNVNEDKVREFGQHVGEFGKSLQQSHADASSSVQNLAQSYQGAGYEQLLATWGAKSDSHMSELVTGCQVVSEAMDVAADVIVGMKVEAIGELVALAAQFIAAQAAAAATFGIAEASVLLIEQEGRQLVKFLEQELTNYVAGQVLEAAVGPLIDKVSQAISGLVYQGVASALGVSTGGGGGAGSSVAISPSAVIAHAHDLQQHAVTVVGHAQAFSAAAGGVRFE